MADFTPLNTEFGVSTGPRVNYNGVSSEFDGPPTQSTDLTVTQMPGDTSPRSFDIGDQYDITFHQGGTTYVLNAAQVIRSDSAAGGAGIIAFEGTEATSGETIHVVWTPGMNLQSWYDTHSGPDMTTGFYNTDQQPGTYAFVCIAADTQVSTPDGTLAAGDLRAGNLVNTLLHGAQPLVWVGHRALEFAGRPQNHRPILFEPGALGADHPNRPLRVSPQHRVLVDLDGDRHLVPAKALLGRDGVSVDPNADQITYVSLMCPSHTVVNTNGVASESFFPGKEAMKLLSFQECRRLEHLFPGVISDPEAYGRLCYPPLPVRQIARHIREGTIHFPRFDPAPRHVHA